MWCVYRIASLPRQRLPQLICGVFSKSFFKEEKAFSQRRIASSLWTGPKSSQNPGRSFLHDDRMNGRVCRNTGRNWYENINPSSTRFVDQQACYASTQRSQLNTCFPTLLAAACGIPVERTFTPQKTLAIRKFLYFLCCVVSSWICFRDECGRERSPSSNPKRYGPYSIEYSW